MPNEEDPMLPAKGCAYWQHQCATDRAWLLPTGACGQTRSRCRRGSGGRGADSTRGKSTWYI